MQMATYDAERGVLGEKQLQRVRNTIKELISELSVFDDEDPVSSTPKKNSSGTLTEKQVKKLIQKPRIKNLALIQNGTPSIPTPQSYA